MASKAPELVGRRELITLLTKILGEEKVKALSPENLHFNYLRTVVGEQYISVIPEKYWQAYTEAPATTREKNQEIIKGGKFLRKLDENVSHKQIHDFLAFLQGGVIEIISGEAIREAYHEKSYSSEQTDTLGRSCMRHEACQPFFDIYVNNPDVCKMLIVRDTTTKIAGRALLWTAKKGEETINVLDRIYGTDKTRALFINYAQKNNFWCKEEQSFSNYTLCHFSTEGKVTKMSAKELEIHGDFTARKYPYMDTFDRLNSTKTVLTHKDSAYGLKSTSGGIGSL